MVTKQKEKKDVKVRLDDFDKEAYEDLELFERRLKFLIEDTPHELKMPLWIESSSGLGKTTRVRDYVEKTLGRKAHILYLATQDIGDLIGLMHEVNGVTEWLKPSWLAKVQEGDVLVLDEFNRAPVYIINAVMSILLENRLHTHQIPNNVQKVALNNIDDGDYQVTTITDPAILSRFIRLKYELSFSEWTDYAKKVGVDPAMIEAVTREPKILGNTTGKHYDLQYHPNSRGATLLGKLLNIPQDLYELINGYEMVSSVLGGEYATIYDKARKENLQVIDLKALLEDFSKVKEQVIRAVDDKDVALLDQLNRKIIMYLREELQDASDIKAIDDQIDNICLYTKELPDGSVVAFFKLLEKDLSENIYTGLLQAIATGKHGSEIFKKVKS